MEEHAGADDTQSDDIDNHNDEVAAAIEADLTTDVQLSKQIVLCSHLT